MTTVFLHLPKTAGTTMWDIAKRQYGPDERVNVPSWFRDGARARASLKEAAGIDAKFVFGHFPFALVSELWPGRQFVTMLRDPIERTLSHYAHVLASPRSGLGAYEVTPATSIEEFVTQDSFPDNLMTRMLSGDDPGAPCTKETLERAKTVLETRFRLVGLAERFDETLILLGLDLGWRDLLYRSARVSKQRPHAADLDAGSLAAIRKTTRFDAALHRHASSLLSARIAENSARRFRAEARALHRANRMQRADLGSLSMSLLAPEPTAADALIDVRVRTLLLESLLLRAEATRAGEREAQAKRAVAHQVELERKNTELARAYERERRVYKRLRRMVETSGTVSKELDRARDWMKKLQEALNDVERNAKDGDGEVASGG